MEKSQGKVPIFPPINVLVPVDGSENSKRALEWAIKLAKIHGSKLWILNAPLVNKYGKQYGRIGEEQGQKIVDEAVSIAEKSGIRAKGDVADATISIVESIVEKAAEQKVDLIVMGTRGTGGFKRLLLGSVSSGVVAHAHCNVLVVR
jgi:nucleotide-binding universal stress UspA family protein